MDHNLDDSLNLESDIGGMDFDHSDVVVNQEDIILETTDHEDDIPMEFEQIEMQPTLMDTGNEEIIVSDFIDDQFTLQQYNSQDYTSKDTLESTDTIDSNQLNILTTHSDSMIDLKFEADTDSISQSISQDVAPQPKYIQVKAAVAPLRTVKKESSVATTMPRQIAIAPKPPTLACSVVNKPFNSGGKQYAIAPKPVTLVANKSIMKKMSLTGVMQGGTKSGNAVLTQIGKQLVMVPTPGGQKLKLVTSGSGLSNMQYAHLISNKESTSTSGQKPLLGKIIVQGQSTADDSNQPAVITKLVSGVSAAPAARYVMQQKTVPITIAGTKVLMGSPTKQGVELKRGIKFRKPILSLSAGQKNITPVSSQIATTTKKVVIKSNPSQNVILKTTAPPKTPQVTNEGGVIMQGQRSQLHQINVPGKGIQYIRLITNPTPAPQKSTTKTPTPVSFVLADNKGTTKPQKKLVRIAPIAAKPAVSVTQQKSRSPQSLLAPLSPAEACVVQVEHTGKVEELQGELEESIVCEEYGTEADAESKAALRAILGDTDETEHHLTFTTMEEVEVEFEPQPTTVQEDSKSMMEMMDSSNRNEDHPLIVIPSNYSKQNQMRVSDNVIFTSDCKDYPNIQVDVEGESMTMPYLSPKNAQSISEPDNNTIVQGELDARPRKACNCTKSQCLKLYCDCFSNGEFCNQCNCNNCHNNLDNEGLRQKAIRACLDRNPNAFRPKIGKSKSGGPEIIRRHNKGCNCKRSGCLKNYCECYEAKIACTTMCKCVGCRNVEETLERRRDALRLRDKLNDPMFRPPPAGQVKQPCSFMTSEVIEAVCQCLIAAAVESKNRHEEGDGDEEELSGSRKDEDPMRDVIEEFARCLQDIISASHQSSSISIYDEGES